MKKYFFFPFLFFFGILTSFSTQQETYTQVKKATQTKQSQLLTWYNKQSNKQVALDSIRKVFTYQLTKKIIPYWYGTKWDFNGYTNIPNQGEIACGYLVSTTLKHTGLQLNRYRMAQQSALSAIKTVCGKEKPLHFQQGDDITAMIKSMNKKLKDGLYVLGMDYHVGYLLKEKNKLYMIHGSYFEPQKVVKEEISVSPAFESSEHFYVGNITYNDKLMKKWIKKETIKIVYDKKQ
ncbi:MAG: hypothetical protein GY827_09605 [Cytophagales bacterium]|nr:hypothetical protein [Cytophagales bacterium]